jgi:asparagine synthase (glutamine-hydrolysing)
MQGLARFMQYGNVPAPLTIFKHAFKLAPGSFFKIDVHTLQIHTETYWNVDSFYQAPKFTMGFEEAKEKTKTLLEASVLARTVSDVPIGLFLSSGYDSTTTAAILQEQLSKPLKTYTVSVPDIGLNEGPKAKIIADYLGCSHTEIACEVHEALDIIERLPTMFDEPFGDSSAIPTFLVSKYAQKEIKVALSADGGDEIFGGYNRYQYYYKIPNLLKNIPKPVGAAMKLGIQHLLPLLSKCTVSDLNIQRLSKFSGLFTDFSTAHYLDSMTKAIQDDTLPSYLKSFEMPPALRTLHGSTSALSELMWSDFTNYLPNDILHKVDRATMAVGLEGREPFLDHELIAFMAQIPDAFKCNANETKILLKSIAHDRVPKTLLEGPKKGFAIPINEWMRKELSDRLKAYAELDFLEKQGVFNPITIQKMIQSFLRGNNGEGLKTWYFLTFQMWYSKWM